uniref:non-specific serine/threonine protein kinase n=2 Tax=Macrostomum lignano TaxID=282301 RepID=A0A1I8GA84_9PLAT
MRINYSLFLHYRLLTAAASLNLAGHLKVERHSVRIGNYELQQTLGSGSFGKVKLGVHSVTGHQVAVKIVSREKLKSMDVAVKLRREIQTLQTFRHPHIVRLYRVVSTPADIFMVMEYVSGGELFHYIVHNQLLSESSARRFFQQILSGVHYCHQRRIVHRDLKPENLLLDSEQRNVKIADFGLSNIMADGELLRTSCGSVNYAAPEVITGQLYVGPEVDVWSCGVILFTLLCGSLPFNESDTGTLYRKIKQASFVMPGHVTEEAADLISSILCADPLRRATIEDIRRHPWFQTDLPAYLFPSDGAHQDLSIVDKLAVAEVATRCRVSERSVLAALLSDDPQSNQLAVAYQLVLDRRLADAAGPEQAAVRRERVRNFYVAEETSGDQQRSAAVASVDAASSIAASTVSTPTGSSAGSGFATAASKQHPERMQGGVPMSRNLEVATSSRGARAKWHLGLRSQSGPYDIMQEVYKALSENNFEWKVLNDFRLRVRRRLNSSEADLAPGSFAKMSLQLFMVEKDSSFLLDFRLVLPGNPKDREMSPASEAAAAAACDPGVTGIGGCEVCDKTVPPCDTGVDWLSFPLSPNYSYIMQFFEMASAVISSLTR